MVSIKVSEGRLSYLHEKLAKLNKKAVKLNLPEIVSKVTGFYPEVLNERGQIKTRAFWSVDLDGTSPGLAYTFVGTVEHHDGGNILRSVPGQEINEKFRQAKSVCAHCEKFRSRKDTFVVVLDGEQKQVGRSCVKDFLGHQSLEQIKLYAELGELTEKAYEDDPGYRFGSSEIQVVTFVVMAFRAIRSLGWVSAKNASIGQSPTSSVATTLYAGLRAAKDQTTPPTEEELAEANEAIFFAKSRSSSSFEKNMAVVANLPALDHKHLGIASCIALSFMKFKEEETRKSIPDTSEWIGSVKDKVEVEVKIVSIRSFEGSFGPVHIYNMADPMGNNIVWKTTVRDLGEENSTFKLRGTIKEHTMFRNKKQTVLTRCKIV